MNAAARLYALATVPLFTPRDSAQVLPWALASVPIVIGLTAT